MSHCVFYFSDTNWNWVDEETLRIMQVAKRDDGEFWMSYKDFCRHFQEVTICTTGPDFDGDGQVDEVGECYRIGLLHKLSLFI
jgi:calpain